jgi:hypothetical protein
MILRQNSQDVVSDCIDGETVLLHMKAGNYYSLVGCAGALWECLSQGASQAQLWDWLNQRYPAEAHRVDLEQWLRQLQQENLVVEATHAAATACAFTEPYLAPSLTKYTDLQDLLLIDPIHDADASGWPALPN